jgi:pilus assembly protein Flp/PilA
MSHMHTAEQGNQGSQLLLTKPIEQHPDGWRKLWRDEEGASLIEYTALIAILLVAVIAVITGVGQWLNNKWTAMNAALP